MPACKPYIDIAEASSLIKADTESDAVHLTLVTNGENSQAYFYDSADGSRVLRINRDADGYYKDQTVQNRINSLLVPIPRIIKLGTIDGGLSYAISERISGKSLDCYTSKEIELRVPDIVEVLENIHSTEPFGTGYGWWGINQTPDGNTASWREWLMLRMKQEEKFPEIKSAVFYEGVLHDKLKQEIDELLTFCPEERKLLHNDFSFPNILSDGHSITAVIDWGNSIYGDPVKDIATLDYRDSGGKWGQLFKRHYLTQGTLPKFYDERLRCYLLLTGLESLDFHARNRQLDKYANEAMKLSKLL